MLDAGWGLVGELLLHRLRHERVRNIAGAVSCVPTPRLYSNTPSDFHFKLESLAQEFGSLSEFAEHLAANVDIVFPVIHGKFGEHGGIQSQRGRWGRQSQQGRWLGPAADAHRPLPSGSVVGGGAPFLGVPFLRSVQELYHNRSLAL